MPGVILIKADTSEFGAVPILSDGLVLFEDIVQVVSMAVTNILDAKDVDNEDKEDGVPLVAPKVWSSKMCNISQLH